MADTYTKNKILTLDAIVIPQFNITITTYEWKINNSIILENLSLVTINTNDLSLGDNTISLRVLNSCGSWSKYVTKTVNIINETIPIPDEVTNMEKTITVVVDQPIETVTILMDYVGTIEITATNGVNPVSGVTIDLNNVPTGLSTDIDGKVSIPNVPYGTHTLKAMKA